MVVVEAEHSEVLVEVHTAGDGSQLGFHGSKQEARILSARH